MPDPKEVRLDGPSGIPTPHSRRRRSAFAQVETTRGAKRKSTRVVQVTLDADVADALTLHATFSRSKPGKVVTDVLGTYLRKWGRGREYVWGDGPTDDLAEEIAALPTPPRKPGQKPDAPAA